MSSSLNSKKNKILRSNINLEINNVLTTKTCAQTIIEIIKYLAYQRLQIPYDYERLKYVVNKKRENDEKQEKIEDTWGSQKYFNLTSNAVDNMEAIFKNILDEFEKKNIPHEMCIIFGSNIISAKEVYRILIPPNINMHHPINHNVGNQNIVRKILRTLIFSNELQTIVYEPLSPMNMYVMLKRKLCNNISYDESSFFMITDRLCIPPKTPQIIINFDYNPVHMDCCDQIRIFNDSSTVVNNEINSANDNENKCALYNKDISVTEGFDFDDTRDWYQAEICLKGFKANFINGHSVSDLWIK